MKTHSDWIVTPEDPKLDRLCDQFRRLSESANFGGTGAGQDSREQWPAVQLDLLAKAGVYRWFVPESLGGAGWSGEEIVSGYVQLGAACLTTTFILTQRVAAIRRICLSDNVATQQRLLPGLMNGSVAATVGISHLTTSRQHIGKPALAAVETDIGFLVNGFSPWVTGANGAQQIVMGAEMHDGRQVLFLVSTESEGLTIDPGFKLLALTGSETGAVRCKDVVIPMDQLLAGPAEAVLASENGTGAGSGGFQTTSLALGLAQAAIAFIGKETTRRPELSDPFESLDTQLQNSKYRLEQLAQGVPVCTNEEIRAEANSLVLRATQAAMVAAKGAGYVEDHPVGRWCRESLFFLVWSCPQAVLNANLFELAGGEIS